MSSKVNKLNCQRCGEGFESSRSDGKWCKKCANILKYNYTDRYEESSRTVCIDCGTSVTRRAKRCKTCEDISRKITVHKVARYKHVNGYIECRDEDGNRKLEHRVVWEKVNNKQLPKGWVVHHLNGVKDDNRPENLVGMPKASHGPRIHIDPTEYEKRILMLEAEILKLRR